MKGNILSQGNISGTRDFIIGANAFTEERSPTDSKVLADRFQNYKWIDLVIPETKDNVVRMKLIEVPDVGSFILKKIRLCPAHDTDLCYKLKETLNKEIEGLKSIQNSVHDLIPEIVDCRHYKDNLESYSCTDILFKLPGNSFTVIKEKLKKNPNMDLVNDLIEFISKLEELNAPYGLILNHNCIIMEGNTRVTILGLGLIEATIIYKAENNQRVKEENTKEIGRYIRTVNPLATSLPDIRKIGELRNAMELMTQEDEIRGTELMDVHSDQGKSRYERISKTTFDQNWLYKPLKAKGYDFEKILKSKIVIIGITVILMITLFYTGYYTAYYNKLNEECKELEKSYSKREQEYNVALDYYLSVNEDYVKYTELSKDLSDLKREEESLSKEIKKLLEIKGGRLLNADELSSFLSAKIDFYDLIKKFIISYKNLTKPDKITFCNSTINGEGLLESFIDKVNDQVHNYRSYRLVEGNDFYHNEDYIILGTYIHRLGSQRIFASVLFSTDSQGVVKETNRFEDVDALQFNRMIFCRDGGLALAGYIAPNDYTYTKKLWILKLYPNKTEEWSYMYSNSYNGAHALTEDVDGGIIAVGSETKGNFLYSRIWVSKIVNGVITWTLSLPNSQYYEIFTTDAKAIVYNSKRSTYMVVGCEDHKPALIVLTGSGELLKHHQYDPQVCLHNIIEIEDGFVAIGTDNVMESNVGTHTMIYKIDYDGSKIWSKKIGDSSEFYKFSAYVAEAIPRGFVIGGKKCFVNQYRRKTLCGDLLMGFDLSGTIKWESQFSDGTIKKIRYKDGKLSVLENLDNEVAIFIFDIPSK